MNNIDMEMALNAIWPDMLDRFKAARNSEQYFVHYTSAKAFLSIAENKSIWLRNASCMNDFGEIEFGIKKITNYFGTERGKIFWETLDKGFNGISYEIKKLFDDWRFDLSSQSYMFCLSEHNSDEDIYGRLSMWRAYSGRNGVAIIVDSRPMLRESDAIGAYTYPVFYLTESEIEALFNKITNNAVNAESLIRIVPRERVKNFAFWLLQTLSFSLKHPAFKEEKEWRIVYQPSLNKSTVLKPKNVLLSGVPQIIYELPLIDLPEKDFTGINPNSLIKKVLVGPSDHPLVAVQAITEVLDRAGIQDASRRVAPTFIPLRQT